MVSFRRPLTHDASGPLRIGHSEGNAGIELLERKSSSTNELYRGSSESQGKLQVDTLEVEMS